MAKKDKKQEQPAEETVETVETNETAETVFIEGWVREDSLTELSKVVGKATEIFDIENIPELQQHKHREEYTQLLTTNMQFGMRKIKHLREVFPCKNITCHIYIRMPHQLPEAKQ